MPAAKCTHTVRYSDGHCKICTRKQRAAWRAVNPEQQRQDYLRRLARQGKQPSPRVLQRWEAARQWENSAGLNAARQEKQKAISALKRSLKMDRIDNLLFGDLI